MKKFLCLLLLIFVAIPVLANMTAKEEQQAMALMQKAEQTKSVDDYNAALDYYIKVSQKYKEPINAGALDSAVILNMDRFNTVQDKKYQTLAKKYANLAIENGTTNTQTAIIGIVLAADDLKPNEMIRYYDYLCSIDSNACKNIKNTFTQQMTEVRQQIVTNKTNASTQRWNAVNSLLYTYIQNAPRHTYSNTTCTGTGSFINCDTLSY